MSSYLTAAQPLQQEVLDRSGYSLATPHHYLCHFRNCWWYASVFLVLALPTPTVGCMLCGLHGITQRLEPPTLQTKSLKRKQWNPCWKWAKTTNQNWTALLAPDRHCALNSAGEQRDRGIKLLAPSAGAPDDYQPFTFTFDRVFMPFHTQEDVFAEISQLVQSALDGYKVISTIQAIWNYGTMQGFLFCLVLDTSLEIWIGPLNQTVHWYTGGQMYDALIRQVWGSTFSMTCLFWSLESTDSTLWAMCF